MKGERLIIAGGRKFGQKSEHVWLFFRMFPQKPPNRMDSRSKTSSFWSSIALAALRKGEAKRKAKLKTMWV